METAVLDAHLQEMFDDALLYHGFVRYMRDYEIITYRAHAHSAAPAQYFQFLFRGCPEVVVRSGLRPDVWSRSMDDKLLTERHVTMDSSGYVWGVESQELYPGPQLVLDSERAREWTERTGIKFHEVDIEANAHHINLIFSDLSMVELPTGYAPFVIGRSTAAETYESGRKIPGRPAFEDPE